MYESSSWKSVNVKEWSEGDVNARPESGAPCAQAKGRAHPRSPSRAAKPHVLDGHEATYAYGCWGGLVFNPPRLPCGEQRCLPDGRYAQSGMCAAAWLPDIAAVPISRE